MGYFDCMQVHLKRANQVNPDTALNEHVVLASTYSGHEEAKRGKDGAWTTKTFRGTRALDEAFDYAKEVMARVDM